MPVRLRLSRASLWRMGRRITWRIRCSRSKVSAVSAHVATLESSVKGPVHREASDRDGRRLRACAAQARPAQPDTRSGAVGRRRQRERRLPDTGAAAASGVSRVSFSWPARMQSRSSALGQAHLTLVAVGQTREEATMVFIGRQGSVAINVRDSSLKAFDANKKVVHSVAPSGKGMWEAGTRALADALQRALGVILLPPLHCTPPSGACVGAVSKELTYCAAAGPEKDLQVLEDAATVADGLAVQYVLDAALRSSREGGRWVGMGGVPCGRIAARPGPPICRSEVILPC